MAIVVDAIYEERYWYPEDGGQVWLAGYQLVEPESGRYLARDAAELAPELDAGRPWSALVLREQRASPRDPRSGLTMLLAPDAELRLRAASP